MATELLIIYVDYEMIMRISSLMFWKIYHFFVIEVLKDFLSYIDLYF